jgi:hypothetical protein
LIEEQKNISKLFNTRDPDLEVARTLEDPQEIEVPIPDKEEVTPSNLRKEYQQHEVTMPNTYKNQNGKRNTETKLTGKKARKLSKKRAKIKKITENSRGNFTEGKFSKLELHRDNRTTPHGTSSG